VLFNMQRSAARAWLGGVLVSHDAPKPAD